MCSAAPQSSTIPVIQMYSKKLVDYARWWFFSFEKLIVTQMNAKAKENNSAESDKTVDSDKVDW